MNKVVPYRKPAAKAIDPATKAWAAMLGPMVLPVGSTLANHLPGRRCVHAGGLHWGGEEGSSIELGLAFETVTGGGTSRQ